MILFIVSSLIHISFFTWVLFHWKRLNCVWAISGLKHYRFSVIIPIRNEADNILNLLGDLEAQSHPKNSFEVILVDDHSEDQGPKICEIFLSKSAFNGKIISLKEARGKKEAITAGVSAAANEIILTTDADCRVPQEWISSYNAVYHQSDFHMITGPVKMETGSFFQKMQQYEFAALIGIGAASLGSGHPGMCNGANLSYKRAAFLKVGGYQGNEHIPSGDDEFLLQKLHTHHPDGVTFLKNGGAIVTTRAKSSLQELVNQRIRWASKWKFHESLFIRLMAIGFFVNYFTLLIAFIWSLQYLNWFIAFLVVFLLRWFTVFIFTKSVLSFLRIRGLFFSSLAGEIFYPLFVTFLGLASIFGKYSWKGRHY